MSNLLKRPVQAGFTLVELLIVVIIVAVLAAIVVPQFSGATLDAKEGALDANLARLRSAIELYNAQHNSVYPGAAASSGGPACSGGTLGNAAAGSVEAFMDQMLTYSTATGATCTVQDLAAGYKYGPYLKKGFPSDSITGKGSVAADISVTTTGAVIAVGASAAGGWRYDTKSGQIVANIGTDVQKDRNDKAFSTH